MLPEAVNLRVQPDLSICFVSGFSFVQRIFAQLICFWLEVVELLSTLARDRAELRTGPLLSIVHCFLDLTLLEFLELIESFSI
jgi:hypothetical protein